MDPLANLQEQLQLARRILEGGWTKVDVDRLAELVLELDAWRRRGGFDPYAAAVPAHAARTNVCEGYADEWFTQGKASGGHFVNALYETCARADRKNLDALYDAFPDLVGAWIRRREQ